MENYPELQEKNRKFGWQLLGQNIANMVYTYQLKEEHGINLESQGGGGNRRGRRTDDAYIAAFSSFGSFWSGHFFWWILYNTFGWGEWFMKWNLKLSWIGYLSTWVLFLVIPINGYDMYDVWWEGFINHTIGMLQFQFQYKNQMLDFLEANKYKDSELWAEWKEYEEWEKDGNYHWDDEDADEDED